MGWPNVDCCLDLEWGIVGECGLGNDSVLCSHALFPYSVYACKLSDREHPLYLRLVAGPRTDTLSFVLREHEIGEVSDCTLLL